MTTPTRILGALPLLALANSACGAMFQGVYGFTEKTERTAIRERRVQLKDLPGGAEVERVESDGRRTTVEGDVDFVPYEVREVVEVPRSRAPSYAGVLTDVAVLVTAALLGGEEHWGASVFIGGCVVVDLFITATNPLGHAPRVVAYAASESKPVTYVVKNGDGTRATTLDVGVGDAHSFDFDDASIVYASTATEASPGGPRAFANPSPAIAFEAHRPPQDPPRSWYGWQTILFDVGWYGGFALSLATKEKAWALGAAAVNAALAPLVHLAHGEVDRTVDAYVLRAGSVAAAGAFAAYLLTVTAPLRQVGTLGSNPSLSEELSTNALPIAVLTYLLMVPIMSYLDASEAYADDEAPSADIRVAPATSRTQDGVPTFGFVAVF